MLESSFGFTFFLKTPRNKGNIRYVYLRITVDGIPKETSTKRKWDFARWDQNTERAIGNKEDARSLNSFLDSLVAKIYQFKGELMYNDVTISSQKIMDFLQGKVASKSKVLQEFQLHNDEIKALIPQEYAEGTWVRFETTKAHIERFIKFKYNVDDIEFRELNYEFVTDLNFYLRTEKKCSNNTALKYITIFKKIVLRAIDKEIISVDPFRRFKARKTKLLKKPLGKEDLLLLENHKFTTERLSVVRDIFIFQCYTGLAYIDAFNLKKEDIKIGVDGKQWIISERQKTGSAINVPLLPKAVELINKYKDHPTCLSRNSVLPVTSNQKMNEYLKEVATLSGLSCTLNTHKARRTFGSTVTLNNDVPIHVVKEMLGHHSIKQTEEYALTEQLTISKEMNLLKGRLNNNTQDRSITSEDILNLEKQILEMKERFAKQIAS